MRKINILIVSAHPYKMRNRIEVSHRLPLGPLYALAAAKRADPNSIKFIDLSLAPPDFSFNNEIQNLSPDLVAVGIHSSASFPIACEIVSQAKSFNQDIITLAGGMFPSGQYQLCFSKSKFDYVLKGEVDDSLTIFINHIQNQKPLSVPGLVCKVDPSDSNTTLSYPDLNILPRIPDTDFDISQYSLIDPLVSSTGKTMNISSARGCPHKCAFCCYSVVGNRKRRIRNANLLINDIHSLAAEYGISQFNFVDDDFLCSKDRAIKFSNVLSHNNFLWRCQSRTDSFSPDNLKDLAKRIYKAGCRLISFGIESGDPYLLRKINKPLDLDWARYVCRTLIDVGIAIRAYIMVGLPYQTLKSVEKTVKYLRVLNPNNVSVELFVPHPGSEIGNNLEKWGIEWITDNIQDRIQRLDWLVNHSKSNVEPCINTKWMTSSEISFARDMIQDDWPPILND
jgi:radical SAM superfamily enzyme YgiQ (UPF0313 family)